MPASRRLREPMVQGGVVLGGVALAVGLAISAAASYTLADRDTFDVVTNNPTSFTLTGFMGKSVLKGGRAPYQAMWMFLYATCLVAALYLVVAGGVGEVWSPENMLTSGVLVGSGLLLTSVFVPTMHAASTGGDDKLLWMFALATAQVGVSALLALVGVWVAETFARGAWTAVLYGVPTGLLAGWLLTAFFISYVLTRTVYDRGQKMRVRAQPEPETGERADASPDWAPAFTAAVVSASALVTRNPAVAVPVVVACLHLRLVNKHKIALGVGLSGWLAASILVLL